MSLLLLFNQPAQDAHATGDCRLPLCACVGTASSGGVVSLGGGKHRRRRQRTTPAITAPMREIQAIGVISLPLFDVFAEGSLRWIDSEEDELMLIEAA